MLVASSALIVFPRIFLSHMHYGMKATTFEEMLAWQKARVLDNKLFELFGSSKNFCFRDQILRASISIMNNIAE